VLEGRDARIVPYLAERGKAPNRAATASLLGFGWGDLNCPRERCKFLTADFSRAERPGLCRGLEAILCVSG